MRIGVIGYYNHGNLGDDRILECLRRFFDGHELLVARDLDNAMLRLRELNSCDFVLLGGGGLILRGTNRHADLIDGLKVRFGCVGLGVEDRHEDNMQFIRAIEEKAEFILVRDVESRELLDNHFKVIVGPDLTFLYPYEPMDLPPGDVCGLNLRPWHWWKCQYRDDEYYRMLDLTSRNPDLRGDWGQGAWDPSMVVDLLQRRFASVQPIAFWSEDGFPGDCDVLGEYLPSVYLQSDITRSYRRVSSLVAMRFHALVFACQMGIPFISLSYQPKCERLCRSLGMENLSVDIYDLPKLEPAIDRLRESHFNLRERLLGAADANHREITYIMQRLLDLVTAGRPARAEAQAQSPGPIAGEPAEQLLRLSAEYSEAGDYEKAIEALRRLLLIDPDHVEALNDLGVLYFATGAHGEAIELLTRAIDLAPNDTLAMSNLADIYLSIGDAESARDLHLRVQQMVPDDEHSLGVLAS